MTDQIPIVFFSQGACSLGAMIVFEWVGKPYKLCKVEKAERQTDLYKRINELGQVPALKTASGEILTENSAVLNHIANLDPSKNLSFKQATPEYDKLNMYMSYYGSNFHVAFYPYFAPMRYHDDEKVQAEIKKKAELNIRTKYEYLDQCFAGYDYHFGKTEENKRPTIADAYAYGMFRWGTKLFDLKKDFPNIAKFMAAQERDPAVQFALAAEKGDEAKSTAAFKGFIKLADIPTPHKQAA